jgi:hypothetical protein
MGEHMRKHLGLMVLALAAAACGSDSNSTSGPVSGTVAGQPFTPTSVKGATADPTLCTTLPQPLGAAAVSAVALSFDTTGAFCSDLGSASCPYHPNGKSVTVFVANVVQATAANPNPTAPRIGPGTYTVDPASTVNVITGGSPLVVTATDVAVDAACTPIPYTPISGLKGGTVRIDTITATQITGYVDIKFCGADPSCKDYVKGTFTADMCSGVNICSAAAAQTTCSVAGMPHSCTP